MRRTSAEIDAREQLRQGHPEGDGNLADSAEAQVVLPALDSTHVGPMNARSLGKLLLRQLPLVP